MGTAMAAMPPEARGNKRYDVEDSIADMSLGHSWDNFGTLPQSKGDSLDY